MVYIIIGIIIIALLIEFIVFLKDCFEDVPAFRFIVLNIVGVGICVGTAAIVRHFSSDSEMASDVLVIALIIQVGIQVVIKIVKLIGNAIDRNAEKNNQTAKLKQETSVIQLYKKFQGQLHDELENNCKRLGYMNLNRWQKKLPNYVEKDRSLNINEFDDTVHNFAVQQEEQNITQNGNWFKPFESYIIEHPQGSTLTKLIKEVSCPALLLTHVTPDRKLVAKRLEKGCKKISEDVPAVFEKVPMQNGDEFLYIPSKYLLHREGKDSSLKPAVQTEISFDDL